MSFHMRYTWTASLPCGSDGDAGERWAGWTAYHTGHNNRDVRLRREERKTVDLFSLVYIILNKMWSNAVCIPLGSVSIPPWGWSVEGQLTGTNHLYTGFHDPKQCSRETFCKPNGIKWRVSLTFWKFMSHFLQLVKTGVNVVSCENKGA